MVAPEETQPINMRVQQGNKLSFEIIAKIIKSIEIL